MPNPPPINQRFEEKKPPALIPKQQPEPLQVVQPSFDPGKEFLVLLNSPGTPFERKKQIMMEYKKTLLLSLFIVLSQNV